MFDCHRSRLHSIVRCFALLALGGSLCFAGEKSLIKQVTPVKRLPQVIISAEAVGDLRLWIPEAVMSNVGTASIYPVGDEWQEKNKSMHHIVNEKNLFAHATFKKIDKQTIEFYGSRLPLDGPVRWNTKVKKGQDDSVEFEIQLTNKGTREMKKACAAVCLKFNNAPWWADERTYVLSGGEIKTLADLGRDAGRRYHPNPFQLYLLKDESFDNRFYHDVWGVNRNTLDHPVMISEHRKAGLCVGITAVKAYFLHSNRGNPCTDLMLAFGDLAPGQTVTSSGRVWIKRGSAKEILTALRKSSGSGE